MITAQLTEFEAFFQTLLLVKKKVHIETKLITPSTILLEIIKKHDKTIIKKWCEHQNFHLLSRNLVSVRIGAC